MDRVANQLGYLILQVDGTVHASFGELANNEHIATIISNLVTIAKSIPPHDEKFKKISIVYSDFTYSVCLSNNRIHIAKLRRSTVQSNNSDTVGSINY